MDLPAYEYLRSCEVGQYGPHVSYPRDERRAGQDSPVFGHLRRIPNVVQVAGSLHRCEGSPQGCESAVDLFERQVTVRLMRHASHITYAQCVYQGNHQCTNARGSHASFDNYNTVTLLCDELTLLENLETQVVSC